MLLACCCLSAIGVLDSLDADRPSGEERLYKARALQEVRRQMSSRETAMEEETMSALLWLTSYEVGNVTIPNATYANAVVDVTSKLRSEDASRRFEGNISTQG